MRWISMAREEHAIFPEVGRRTPGETVPSVRFKIDKNVPAEDDVARLRLDWN